MAQLQGEAVTQVKVVVFWAFEGVQFSAATNLMMGGVWSL